MKPDTILEQTRVLRTLARTITGNVHDADDVVQNTWLSLLQHPPRDRSRPHAWLSTVVANHARQHWRSEGRRARRECRVAREVPRVAAASKARAADAHDTVMAALLQLPEIHRTAIQMRYLEGLRPGEIARRLRIPAETIRSRVHRGLQQMRGVLRCAGCVDLPARPPEAVPPDDH